jgi:hypothetical protein
MNWLWLVSYFLGGVFAANAIPHFVTGTMGRPDVISEIIWLFRSFGAWDLTTLVA